MSDPVNPIEFFDISQVYLEAGIEKFDTLICRFLDGSIKCLKSYIGSDPYNNSEIFVTQFENLTDDIVLHDGVWHDVDRKKVELCTKYQSNDEGNMIVIQEFVELKLLTQAEMLVIKRSIDKFEVTCLSGKRFGLR